MRPRLRAFSSALVIGLCLGHAPSASAQFYDAAQNLLDFSTEPLSRSVRLFGMGRLTLVGHDPHNQIAMWDFAGNPIGVASDDTSSTIELRPGSASHAAVRDDLPGSTVERQILAGREYRAGFEGWRRTPEGTAYGGVGDVGILRLDRPFTATTERRETLTDPKLQAIITGRVPWVIRSPNFHYALRSLISKETTEAEYRANVTNPSGIFIDQEGPTLDQPVFLVPNQYDVVTIGGGLALAYRFGSFLEAALGGDILSQDVEGKNQGKRYHAGTHESRTAFQGQGTLIGRIGSSFEWGVDGRMRGSESDPTWDFSVSAGIGTDPLVGRGSLLNRQEFTTSFRSRARWELGPFEVGGSITTAFQELEITPPDTDDPTSLNAFLNTITMRPNADSLALPDSVLHNVSEQRNREAAIGAAWHLPGGGGMIGAEYRVGREDLNQTVSLHGPRREVSEFRTGLEVRLTDSFTGRGGWFYRNDDRDVLTYGNRYAGNGVTVGLGLRPGRAIWSLEAGYLFSWYRILDGDPTQRRGTRQQFQTQLRWAL